MKLSKMIKLPTLSKNKKLTQPTPNYLLWAFLLPFLGMLTVLLLKKCEPFGNQYSHLYSDEFHQYYPFFHAFRRALLSGDSIQFNWDVGMGLDYLGLIAYYLASPLNLLGVFVPESLTLEYFTLLSPTKLGLASLCFAFFLKKLFGKDDFSIAIFGSFYGLCAWALGYQWNVMWLDSFALLPLVALGTVYLLRDKKFVLYTLSLFMAIFANYYIGLFVCIFVFLVFVCYQICRCTSIKRFFLDLGRIAVFSILAIGMTAILELPALAALQNTQSSVNSFPEYFRLNLVPSEMYQPASLAWTAYKEALASDAGFLECVDLFVTAVKESVMPMLEGMRLVAGQMAGAHEHSFKEGLPNLHCGLGTVVLAFLFLTAKEVKLRDKICSVFLLVFFMLSILIRQLDYIWHGFHFTNMIPYRFTFLFSFVLLYMAYRAWLLRDSFQLWQFIVAGLFTACIIICADDRSKFVYFSYNIAILLLILGILIYTMVDRRLDQKKEEELSPELLAKRETARKKYSTWALLGVMGLELVLNLANFGIRFSSSFIGDYPRQKEKTTSAIRYMYEREKYSDFFRAEVTSNQTLNDGALNGYSGITTFTSSANVRITEFMEALGYAAKNTYNRYSFEEASPVSNLFLNLKYMIERDGNVEENSYFDTVHNFGQVYLLENNAYLPLGFLAEKSLADWDVEQAGNSFLVQNTLFTMATGVEENVWSILDNEQLTVTAHGVTINSQNAIGYTNYTAKSTGTLRYSYQIDKEGFFCIRATMADSNKFRVYKNGKELFSEKISLPQMFAVSDVQIGDTIMIEITCNAGTNGINIRPAVLNEEVFRRGYDILAASTLDLTEFSNTRIEGTIECNRDGLLYTSVPYDGNWQVTVDGEPTEIVLVGNCMIGMEMTKGKHTVKFTYKNDALILGAAISVVCAATFVALIVISRSSPKSKGKFEN